MPKFQQRVITDQLAPTQQKPTVLYPDTSHEIASFLDWPDALAFMQAFFGKTAHDHPHSLIALEIAKAMLIVILPRVSQPSLYHEVYLNPCLKDIPKRLLLDRSLLLEAIRTQAPLGDAIYEYLFTKSAIQVEAHIVQALKKRLRLSRKILSSYIGEGSLEHALFVLPYLNVSQQQECIETFLQGNRMRFYNLSSTNINVFLSYLSEEQKRRFFQWVLSETHATSDVIWLHPRPSDYYFTYDCDVEHELFFINNLVFDVACLEHVDYLNDEQKNRLIERLEDYYLSGRRGWVDPLDDLYRPDLLIPHINATRANVFINRFIQTMYRYNVIIIDGLNQEDQDILIKQLSRHMPYLDDTQKALLPKQCIDFLSTHTPKSLGNRHSRLNFAEKDTLLFAAAMNFQDKLGVELEPDDKFYHSRKAFQLVQKHYAYTNFNDQSRYHWFKSKISSHYDTGDSLKTALLLKLVERLLKATTVESIEQEKVKSEEYKVLQKPQGITTYCLKFFSKTIKTSSEIALDNICTEIRAGFSS